jgi:hypothetical protein
MGMAELEEIQALLEHVLPDPSGFAQRLVMQAMARWGQSASSGASAYSPWPNDFYPVGATEGTRMGKTVIPSDQVIVEEAPIDINMLLAAALGACECWGLRRECPLCGGHGAAGWAQPEAELFEEFIQPAIARFPHVPSGDHEQHGNVNVGENSDHYHTAKGKRI